MEIGDLIQCARLTDGCSGVFSGTSIDSEDGCIRAVAVVARMDDSEGV